MTFLNINVYIILNEFVLKRLHQVYTYIRISSRYSIRINETISYFGTRTTYQTTELHANFLFENPIRFVYNISPMKSFLFSTSLRNFCVVAVQIIHILRMLVTNGNNAIGIKKINLLRMRLVHSNVFCLKHLWEKFKFNNENRCNATKKPLIMETIDSNTW